MNAKHFLHSIWICEPPQYKCKEAYIEAMEQYANYKIEQMKKKDNRGGKRKGAGRKKLAPTKTVSFRVKVEEVESVQKVVSEFLGGKKNLRKNCR